MISFSLNLAGNCFHLAHDAQNVSAQDLLDMLTVVTTIVKGLRDFWQVRSGINALRQGSHAIEI